MPYIQYTAEQKEYANSVSLVDFLLRRGEKLKKSGSEYRWVSGHGSMTIKENKWHRHSVKEGGYPVSFCMEFLNMKYQDAMNALLDGVMNLSPEQLHQKSETAAKVRPPTEKESFALPPKSDTMKRTYAYLTKARGIDSEVVNTFVRAKKIYEEEAHHNIVFVGHDENDKARYAHQKGTLTYGDSFCGEVKNSDKQYGFNYRGTSNRLHVFESPVDMLSYISLNKDNWQEHSYLALGGVAEKALLHFLHQNESVSHITLCLDTDNAGIEAMSKIIIPLTQMNRTVDVNLSKGNDWNDNLREKSGRTMNHAIYKGERPNIFVFADSLDMIAYMAMRRHIESIVKDNPPRSKQVWHRDSYFSLASIMDNSLAYYLKAHAEIETVNFMCSMGRNEEQAAQVMTAFEKYYFWAEKAGYKVDFKMSHNRTWDMDLKAILMLDPGKIKEAHIQKQEPPQMEIKM